MAEQHWATEYRGFLIYMDQAYGYRWRKIDDNHRIIADSGEAYVSESGAVRAIDNLIGEIDETLAAEQQIEQAEDMDAEQNGS